MKYIPHLIPERSRILKDYFKATKVNKRSATGVWNVIGWIAGSCFLLMALASIHHPILMLIFGLLGLILLPPGQRWLERSLQFRMTRKIKLIAAAGLFVLGMPLTAHFDEADKQEVQLQKLREEKKQEQLAMQAKKDQERKDSLALYIGKIVESGQARKKALAYQYFDQALDLAKTTEELRLLKEAKLRVASFEMEDLVKGAKYKAALLLLDSLLVEDGDNAELLYSRAICYSKTGNMEEAVYDCKMAISQGHTAAEKLHNTINPLLKRVSYYVTRCCDGSTSNAKGRGACSHHGGVCDWNEPVYETYRKYQ